jgi:hypothetical protein
VSSCQKEAGKNVYDITTHGRKGVQHGMRSLNRHSLLIPDEIRAVKQSTFAILDKKNVEWEREKLW